MSWRRLWRPLLQREHSNGGSLCLRKYDLIMIVFVFKIKVYMSVYEVGLRDLGFVVLCFSRRFRRLRLIPVGRLGPGYQSGRAKEVGGQSLLAKAASGKMTQVWSWIRHWYHWKVWIGTSVKPHVKGALLLRSTDQNTLKICYVNLIIISQVLW